MPEPQIDQVRRFNRLVTQTIGALHDDYLGSDRPLGESRLLFEIGSNGATARELRARLELDSGYVSRLLRSLEHQGLVITRSDRKDKRIRRAQLTDAGLEELEELDCKSDRLAQSILNPLDDRQRASLTEAMATVERLLSAAAVRIDEESPNSPDAQFCLSSYLAELSERFETGFDPALSLSPSLDEYAPPRGTFIVMRLHGAPVGCGGSSPCQQMSPI